MRIARKVSAIGAALTLGVAGSVSLGAVVFTDAGDQAADIQDTVDAFRSALGTLNANAPTSFPSGRREINWDAVPDAFADPNTIPGNFFNQNFAPRARGLEFNTPGTGFLVSANASNDTGTPIAFGFAGGGSDFRAFSPQRLFIPVGSLITEVRFFFPDNPTQAAGVKGFGVVFNDVEAADTTFVEFFGADGQSLGLHHAQTAASGGFSFVGLLEEGNGLISKARISTGSTALLANGLFDNPTGDGVAMDDFIYGEPAPLPEPTTAVMWIGLAVLGITTQHRPQRRV